jgi:dihydrofolate reductase
MRKIIFSVQVTLDGCIDHTAMIADEETHVYATELLRATDLVLFGRVAYELFAGYWPTAPADASFPKSMLDYARTLNPLPKMVFSKTLQNAAWNTSIARAVIPEEIAKMKRQPGEDIALAGGAGLATTFMRLGLIDEYHLLVNPIVLGAGKPLSKGLPNSLKLTRLRTQTFGSGVVALVYQPAG